MGNEQVFVKFNNFSLCQSKILRETQGEKSRDVVFSCICLTEAIAEVIN